MDVTRPGQLFWDFSHQMNAQSVNAETDTCQRDGSSAGD